MSEYGQKDPAGDHGTHVSNEGEPLKSSSGVSLSRVELCAALDELPVGAMITVDSCVVFINRMGLELVGASSIEELLEHDPARQFLEIEQLAMVERARDQLRSDGGEERFSFSRVPFQTLGGRRRFADITSRWIDFGGEPARLIIGQDVTGQRVEERRLRQLELAVLKSHDAILLVEVPQGDEDDSPVISHVNEAFTQLTGYSPEEVIGQPSAMLLSPGSDGEAVAQARQKLARGEPVSLEFAIRTKDGSEQWVESSVTPVQNEDLGLHHHVIAWREVSARRKLQQQLMRVERVVAIGSLAASIGHEINNPLAYVRANVDFCLERWRDLNAQLFEGEAEHGDAERLDATLRVDLEELREAMLEASEGIERINDIAADLRKFANLGEGSLRAVDLRDVLQSVLNLMRNEIRHKATLEVDLEALPPVLGSDAKLNQLFLNLLLNAAQALPMGSPSEHFVRLRARARGGEILVEVSDSGPGIPPEQRERIFEPFFTTRNHNGGSGLGLAIAQGVVNAHGGRIEVDEAPSGGALFRVSLPAALTREEPSEPYQETLAASLSEGRASLLIIDDEAPILRVVSRLLSREHDVEGCRDPLEARARLVEQGDRFDVIFCDVTMPELDGIALFEELRGARPEQASRFVFLTGGALNEKQRSFLKSAKVPIVYKPFSKDELLELIARHH